ncbi:hypothetical protein JCM19233_7362 [Vibrio astriarenae]|nr:hypothetical protein JCM19233_7362 [Vibrio sp. C7]
MGDDSDGDNKITQFDEKPESPSSMPGDPENSLASMGIYIFNIDT